MTGLLGNLDDLVAQVRRRAEQRALALTTQTETKASRILEEADERARDAAAAIREQGRRDADEACRQCLAVADLERRRRRLEAREGRLERIWSAAHEELTRRAEGGVAADTLARLARYAAGELGVDEVEVRLDAASRQAVSDEAVAGWAAEDGPELRPSDAALERGHGLIAVAGRASVDATFEGRLAQARERLRAEVDALLMAEREDRS